MGRGEVSGHVLNKPIVKKMLEELKEFAQSKATNKPVQGKYQINSIGKDGFSFRVFSKDTTLNSLSIIFIWKGEDNFRVQSAEIYRNFLSHKKEAVEKWINFVEKDLGTSITNIDSGWPDSIPFDRFEKNFSKFIDAIKELI